MTNGIDHGLALQAKGHGKKCILPAFYLQCSFDKNLKTGNFLNFMGKKEIVFF